MARFIPGVLGTPVGKLKNQVFRIVNGKPFISNRPDSYIISQSKSAKNSRQAFALVVKFAKLITSSAELAYCWKKAKIKGTSAYHRIIKYNLPLTKDGTLSLNNCIVPKGFGINLESTLKKDLSVSFIVNLAKDEISTRPVQLNIYIIIALNKNTSLKQSTEFIFNVTSFDKADYTGDIKFTISFSESEKKKINKFKQFIIYSTVVVVSETTIKHSSNVAKAYSL